MQSDLKLEAVTKALQLRHELSAIASGLISLRSNLQQKHFASEQEVRILERCLSRVTKLIVTVDQLKVG